MRPLTLLVLAASCGVDPDAYRPDLFCPDDPSGICDEVKDAPLRAGAAVRSILPTCWEDWTDLDGDENLDRPAETYRDCGCDRLCEGDAGYPGPDAGEGDGQWQAAWLAGGDVGTPIRGVRGADRGLRGEGDGLWARAIVLDQGETRVAIVAVDLVGVFNDEVVQIREALAGTVDHVVLSSTHVHAGPDMMGLWGRSITESGYNPDYAAQVRSTVVEAVQAAAGELRPVTLAVGAVDASTYNAEQGVFNVNSDTRDPWIVDPWLRVATFTASNGDNVATLISWASHPETMLDDSALMTSDFVHALRATVEDGVTWEGSSQQGIGGTAIYLNGAVGGMMTTLRVHPIDPDGVQHDSKDWVKVDVIGQLLGGMALDAAASATPAEEPQLGFAMHTFEMPVENEAMQAMVLLGVLDRSSYRWDDTQPITDDNLPWIRTEVDVVSVGPLQILTIPGEPLPELIDGGYDGSLVNAPGKTLIKADNPNPPDVAAAPAGPYLRASMTGEVNMVVGLGNDEVGYMIPPYDFQLGAAPYVTQADGDHYEETNSLGPDTAVAVEAEARALLEWWADPKRR